MAYIPDIAVLNFPGLSSAELRLYILYCYLKDEATGFVNISDIDASNQIRMSRSRACEARNGLVRKGWISYERRSGIQLTYGFRQIRTPALQSNSTAENIEEAINHSLDMAEETSELMHKLLVDECVESQPEANLAVILPTALNKHAANIRLNKQTAETPIDLREIIGEQVLRSINKYREQE